MFAGLLSCIIAAKLQMTRVLENSIQIIIAPQTHNVVHAERTRVDKS